ncbi:MAG: hypothetical protein IKN71_04320 [Alphaproteobacteria bacterium]|nr:hypothetical protein [Alphaproteobacteria bacterium]
MMFRLLIMMLGIGGLLCGGFAARAEVTPLFENRIMPAVTADTSAAQVSEDDEDDEYDADDEETEFDENDEEFDEVYTVEEYVAALEGKNFRNPNMQYGKSSDVSEVVKNALMFDMKPVTAQDAKNPEKVKLVYIMKGEKAISEMMENGENCLAYVDDAINERAIINDDIDTENLQYKYVCESRVSTVSKEPVEVCEGEDIADVIKDYKECVLSLSVEDSDLVDKLADCKKQIDEYKTGHCQTETNVETSVECGGKRYFTVKDANNKGIMYIPLERSGDYYKVSPDMAGLEYQRVVEKLLDKYGPATHSIRRKHYGDLEHCSNLASYVDFQETGRINRYYSDTYYWKDKNWIVRCQVVFNNEVVRPLDDTPVKYVSTIYINRHALENTSRKDEEIDILP